MTAVFASPPEPGTNPKYPFAQWFDGQEWSLTRGRDFWGPVGLFMRKVQGSANSRQLKIVMAPSDDGRTLTVRVAR